VAGEAWPPRTSEGESNGGCGEAPRVVLRLGFGVFIPFRWWACCNGVAAMGPAWWWPSWCGGVCILFGLFQLWISSNVSTATFVWLMGGSCMSAFPLLEALCIELRLC
jgi:hypothetical protein